MAVTETMKKLVKTMIQVNLSEETAGIIISHLRKQEQQEEMIQYLKEWEDIMTDHQAIQHMDKILRRKN